MNYNPFVSSNVHIYDEVTGGGQKVTAIKRGLPVPYWLEITKVLTEVVFLNWHA